MPRRDDVHKVLIIGSGPIIIGQACEFDYSGTQACKALRSLGYEIVLVNSNPATIMTDPVMADATYIEPLNVETLEEIIALERPDALLPNLGGQSGLNLSAELARAGVLERYGVNIIGIKAYTIEQGEDRLAFKQTMSQLGIETPRSEICYTVEECERVAAALGYPVVIRPAYTMGGTGGGLVYNREELQIVAARGIRASLVGQVLVEESVVGWEELEVEVVRDIKNQMVTVCFIENVDAVGVHTGDSFCTAPMLTIAPDLQAKLQKYSYDIVETIGVIGGTNVQFAHDPHTGRVVVIEINPRTSRSSALASKATGFPIASVSAGLAGGLTLDEIPYWRDGTLDKYTPSGDHVVVKFARWAFEKFPGAQDKLGTQMRAVGEVMSIGHTYKEALQKAIRSLEKGRHGLGFAKDFHDRELEDLLDMLAEPSSERHFIMYEALRKGASTDLLSTRTHVKPWFIEQMRELVELEERVLAHRHRDLPDELLTQAKKDGFADAYLASLLNMPEADLRARRRAMGLVHGYRPVPVSGVADDAAYYYSTYNAPDQLPVSDRRKVMVLGGGPNRIGQGIEFDYCCVHAAFALRDAGFETIMVNCNPETVSTDYDTSDRLYFEPVTLEDVLNICDREQPRGVIVQFGGQTPLNLADALWKAGVPVIGTTPASIARAEDRKEFRELVEKLQLLQPPNDTATSIEEAREVAARIGYPVVVRPSFVLGGRAMEIVYDQASLDRYMGEAVSASPERPILIDRFLENAIEIDVDALCDGHDVVIGGIMQHIEEAGVHSGDSACILPPHDLPAEIIEEIKTQTRALARELNVVGLMNIQYAVQNHDIYVLEVNPRASRTVPFVSKATGVPLAKLAARVMAGKTLRELGVTEDPWPAYVSAKEVVLPFIKFPGVDILLGPEMRSTGEVMGIDSSMGLAFAKSQVAAGNRIPMSGTVFLSLNDRDKNDMGSLGQDLVDLGFSLMATHGTAEFLQQQGIAVQLVTKVGEERPHIVDRIINGEVQWIINTPLGGASKSDGREIRRTALERSLPIMTTLSAARAAVMGIRAMRQGNTSVRSLQEYHGKR